MREKRISEAGTREELRYGGVSTAKAVEDSPHGAMEHINDHEDWIRKTEDERNRYSALAHEIHGQTSYASWTRNFIAKVWDSIGMWIAVRTGTGSARATNEMISVKQTYLTKERDEVEASFEAGIKHSPEWIRENHDQLKAERQKDNFK